MLEGKFVKLAEYKKEYLEKAREMINDWEVKKYLTPGIPFPLRIEDEEKWYSSLNPFGNGTYSFAILLKDTNEYIGGCGVNTVDWKNSVAEIGIFLGSQYHNKGYGTDAMEVLIRFIFKEMNINKIRLHTYSFNKRGIRVYEKVGFKTEGVLRKEIFREGQYHDIVVMGLLREEWQEK